MCCLCVERRNKGTGHKNILKNKRNEVLGINGLLFEPQTVHTPIQYLNVHCITYTYMYVN
jgi:hypothetical protein